MSPTPAPGPPTDPPGPTRTSPSPRTRTLLTLRGLPLTHLPPSSATSAILAPFLSTLLEEAIPLVDDIVPSPTTTNKTQDQTQDKNTAATTTTYKWTPLPSKSYRPTSAAPVELYKVTTTTSTTTGATGDTEEGGGKGERETWIARRSVHADAAEQGTASFGEFERYLRDGHVETEAASMEAVAGVWRGGVWGVEGVEIEVAGTRWNDFSMAAVAMRHRIGRPVLKDRVFPLVQVTCSASPSGEREGEFLVISLHVPDLLTSSALPDETSGHGSKIKDMSKQDIVKNAVAGAYVSVERVRKIPGRNPDDGNSIEWIMATASDAKGVLPMFVQTMAVPGQVAPDVPYFFGWLTGERERKAVPRGESEAG